MGWGGCVRWSEAVGLRKGRVGQDDTRTYFPLGGLQRSEGVCVCAALKETELSVRQRLKPRIMFHSMPHAFERKDLSV